MKKISIIIPVYNSEKYLEECLDSILNQNYTNIEVVLVNDGSVDSSETICKKYAKKDKRIKLINKENGGVSSARNRGIIECTGDYIMFIDSDDMLHQKALENISNNICENDTIVFGYTRKYKHKEEINICNYNLKIEDIEEKIISDDCIGGYLWNKVFSSNIIKNNKIIFNENIHFCEDLVFVLEYIKFTKKIKYISKSLYLYRMRKGNTTDNLISQKTISILKAYDYLQKETNNVNIKNKIRYYYLIMYFQLCPFLLIDDVNEEILKSEKEIISYRSFNEKIKYLMVRKIPRLYVKIKKLKYSDLYN